MIKPDARLNTLEELLERLASINKQIEKMECKESSPYPEVFERQNKAFAKLVSRRDAIEKRIKR